MSKYVFPFEKLEVYQMTLDLADRVLEFLEELPPNRHIRLISQMEAAVVSSAQNIAEGKGRQYKKEFIQFLYIAEGSLFETLTLAEIMKRRGLIVDEQLMEIKKQAENIDRKLHG